MNIFEGEKIMSKFTDEIMVTIETIKEFIKNNPNSDAVEKYYLTHGTFTGIVEYLNEINKSKTAFPKD